MNFFTMMTDRIELAVRWFYIAVLVAMLFLVTACGLEVPSISEEIVSPTGTFILPTAVSTLQPTPINTRVNPKVSPTITPTVTPLPAEVLGLVVEVIDGNTIAVVMRGDRLSRAYVVRYLNINTLPNKPDNPWGVVAYETNRDLTRLKVVRLVRDQTEADADGRLLRYVYLGKTFMNVMLVEKGLAKSAIRESDTTFRAEILVAESRAKGSSLGLWGPLPTATPIPTPMPAQPTEEKITAPIVKPETITPTLIYTPTLTPTVSKD